MTENYSCMITPSGFGLEPFDQPTYMVNITWLVEHWIKMLELVKTMFQFSQCFLIANEKV